MIPVRCFPSPLLLPPVPPLAVIRLARQRFDLGEDGQVGGVALLTDLAGGEQFGDPAAGFFAVAANCTSTATP
jgi:hypothetical protein